MPKFIYFVTLNNGTAVRIETAGNPVEHPSIADRWVSVETLGEVGNHLAVV